MSREDVLKRLAEIFRDVFEDKELDIEEKNTASDIEEWDSLNHINLVVAIESEFKIKMKMKDILDLKNIGDMVNVIMKEIGE